jgi:hypothetical protein
LSDHQGATIISQDGRMLLMMMMMILLLKKKKVLHLERNGLQPATVNPSAYLVWREENVVGRDAVVCDALCATYHPDHHIWHAVLGLQYKKQAHLSE